MSKILDAALEYEKAGLSVIPINPSNKKPLINWKPYQTQRATLDEIWTWWEQFPLAMIGLVTGPISGFMVLDGDSPEQIKTIKSLLPDGLVTPISKIPAECTTLLKTGRNPKFPRRRPWFRHSWRGWVYPNSEYRRSSFVEQILDSHLRREKISLRSRFVKSY